MATGKDGAARKDKQHKGMTEGGRENVGRKTSRSPEPGHAVTRTLAQDPPNVASKLSAWSKTVCFTPRCLSPLCGDLGLPLPTGLPAVPSTQSQRDARGWARRGDGLCWHDADQSVCCCGFSNGIHRCVPERGNGIEGAQGRLFRTGAKDTGGRRGQRRVPPSFWRRPLSGA